MPFSGLTKDCVATAPTPPRMCGTMRADGEEPAGDGYAEVAGRRIAGDDRIGHLYRPTA